MFVDNKVCQRIHILVYKPISFLHRKITCFHHICLSNMSGQNAYIVNGSLHSQNYVIILRKWRRNAPTTHSAIMFSNITILAPICPLATCCYQCQPSLRPGWVRFCRHVTSNHVMSCPLWWACGSHGDNIGSSEYHPSHIGLESGVWPSGSHRSQEKNEYSPIIYWRMIAGTAKMTQNVLVTQV